MAITIDNIKSNSYEYVIFGAPYQIKITVDMLHAFKWCEQKFGNIFWCHIEESRWKSSNDRWAHVVNKSYHLFGFANESDYMEFVLRWV